MVAAAIGCGSKSSSDEDAKKAPVPVASGSGSAIVLVADPPLGLDLRLSNGKQARPDADTSKLAPGKPLADGDVTALLARSKPIEANATDKKTFALRPGSQPLPRTGQTITGAFPPDPSTLLPPVASDAAKDLTVLRYMPEGPVPLAPQLTVTFSHPMVAVTSQEEAAKVQPVKLTPTPKGAWRWLGTRTIVFDPDVRFPQATTYQVEVPVGTRSATGAALAKPVTFAFETPAPVLVAHWPSDYQTQRTDEPMFLLFDQKVDAKAILAKVAVKVGTNGYAVQELDAAAIAANEHVKDLVEAAHQSEQDGRWVAFRATKPFPTDAQVEVTLPVGTPSAEGPNPTKVAQLYSFRTYPPLRLMNATCGYNECRPGTPLTFEFTNVLDLDKLEALKAKIVVTPPLELKITSYGQNLMLAAATTPRTRYHVTIPSALEDAFGQTLGHEESRDFAVGDAYPSFYGPNGLVVLDPAAPKPTLDFFATNYANLRTSCRRSTSISRRRCRRRAWGTSSRSSSRRRGRRATSPRR
ncbi:MAG: Ig-like domain-containing protein [Proteobacteria bacterium]|nr:Ig-like domain-containing protein [Pseudomonadota bacterium]